VPGAAVALGAARLTLSNVPMRGNIADHCGMAFNTIVLQVFNIRPGDPDGFRKILQCERFGMIIPVTGFSQIFLNESVRYMAIITGRGAMMTGFNPRIIIPLHYMTIRAS